MEDLVANVIKDLPSTAALIVFMVMTNKQSGVVLDLIQKHLSEISGLLETCIKTKELEDRTRSLEEREKNIELQLIELRRLASINQYRDKK